MIQWFKRLVFAIQMGTILPFSASPVMSEDDYPRALSLFPLTGLIVGSVSMLFAMLGLALRSKLLAACFAVITNLVLTKAFHLDGWCDTIDALGSSRDRDAKLNIMKDSHIGTMGTAGAIVDIGLRCALIYELAGLSYFAAIAAIMIAPVAAKLALVTAGGLSKSARSGGLGSAYVEKLSPADVLRAAVITALILLAIVGLWAAAYVAVAMLLGALCAAWFKRVLGGMTGDALGFTNELCEIVMLLSCYVVYGIIRL